MLKKTLKGTKLKSKPRSSSKGGRIKKSKSPKAKSVSTPKQSCIFIKVIKGKFNLTVTEDAFDSQLSLQSSTESNLDILDNKISSFQLWLNTKKFKDTFTSDEVKKFLTMQNDMESHFMENTRIIVEKEQPVEVKAFSFCKQYFPAHSANPLSATGSDEGLLDSLLGPSRSSFYNSLNPKWGCILSGSVQEILQNILNEEREITEIESNENSEFLTGSNCSVNDSALDSSLKKTDSPKRASPSSGDELRKLQHEIKKAQTEIASLKVENSQLKDEGVRLRKVAITDTVMSTPSHSTETSTSQVSAFPPVVYIIAAIILGLIIGKFIL